MAVYNRQYWFRLFAVLQREFRLTARLMGMWTFNGYASKFLERHPPRHYDVQRAADGFAEFLLGVLLAGGPARLDELDEVALREASQIDQAFRTVLAAPAQEPFVIAAAQAQQLARARLLAAPTWVLLSESWPLMALRQQLANDEGEAAVPLPEPHAQVRHWARCSQVHRGMAPCPSPRCVLAYWTRSASAGWGRRWLRRDRPPAPANESFSSRTLKRGLQTACSGDSGAL